MYNIYNISVQIEMYKVSSAELSKFGKPHEFDPNFKGPTEKRTTTDIFFLILYFLICLVWIFLLFFAVVRSDIARLINPTDSDGNVCGSDESVRDKPYLLFFDITKCASEKVAFTGCPTPQICVEECPQEDWVAKNETVEQEYKKAYCDYGINATAATIKQLIKDKKCTSYYFKSSKFANRCIPRDLSSHKKDLLDNKYFEGSELYKTMTYDHIVDGIKYLSRFVQIQEVVEGVIFDIQNLWYIILILCVVAMVLSLLWIMLMRCFATITILFSFFAFGALFIYGGYVTMSNYLKTEVEQTDLTNTIRYGGEPQIGKGLWLTLFIIIMVLLVICVLLIIFLRKRILIAIELIKEASKAIGDASLSLFFPTGPYILQLVVIFVFGVIVALLTSVGHSEYRVFCHGPCSCPNIQENSTCVPGDFIAPTCNDGSEITCQFYSHRVHQYIMGLQFFNVFAFFWVICFIGAFEEMVLAGTFSTWYWHLDKKDLPKSMISGSLYKTTRFHLGTIAAGSLIIAIIKVIRAIFEYIDYQLKKYTDNSIAKCCMCFCRCCLWCLENFMRFVNRNAYIYCAVYGTNFCTSARKSFNLLMRNILRVVVLDKVADLLLFIGKLTITGLMTLLTFAIFSQEFFDLRDGLPPYRFAWTPVFIVAVASFFIATSFFGVYNMAVDTIFLCFLEDCERNDGSVEKPYCMSKKLMKILSKKNDNAEVEVIDTPR